MKHNGMVILLAVSLLLAACVNEKKTKPETPLTTRQLADTVGFAQYSWQMMELMERLYGSGWDPDPGMEGWKLAICPHDDYTYVGTMYPNLLEGIKASTVFLIGVAHRAASLSIEDSLVFDSYTFWKGPWKDVEVSAVREEVFELLKDRFAIVSDSLHNLEHSLESLIPFLQYFNRDIKIIPVLVPAMSPDRMEECGKALAGAIAEVSRRRKWEWGSDYTLLATSDAVHYGNEDWGGVNRAYFGCDSRGNQRAILHEYQIINNCLTGAVNTEKIRKFSDYTISHDDYRQYRWTWCGRYSVPVALYTAYFLNELGPVKGDLLEYSTSITRFHVPVEDLGMGYTAIATPCHWVGYASLGYR